LEELMSFCPTGKISYPSPADAWRTIEFMSARRARHTHTKSGKGGFAYQCGECGQWHTTRSQRTVGRPAQEVA